MNAATLLAAADIPAPWKTLCPGEAVPVPQFLCCHLVVREDGAIVARVLSADPHTCQRNAQLIAAAPEMLAALRVITNCVADHLGGVTLGSYEQGIVRAALLKAGVTP